MIRNILVSILFSLILFSASFAQNSKIAVILFDKLNTKDGVSEYYSAMNTLSQEFCCGHRIFELQNKVETLTSQLSNKNLTAQLREEKQKQINVLRNDIETSTQEIEKRYLQRYKIVVQPIVDEMDIVLNVIAKENNLNLIKIFDSDGKILYLDRQINITKKVIPNLNNYFKTGEKSDLKMYIPSSKIAIINTENFKDEKTGIRQYIALMKEIDREIRKEMGDKFNEEQYSVWSLRYRHLKDNVSFKQIPEAMQKFAELKGFNLIIDSSNEIPTELKNIPTQDVTKDFISYYNQLNP